MKKLKIREVSIDKILENPENPRAIMEEAFKGLSASLKRFGLVEPLVYNIRTNRLVGGHQRLRVLKATGEKMVEVVEVDLSETDEAALNVALNNPKIQGHFTEEVNEIVYRIGQVDAATVKELKLEGILTPDWSGYKTDDVEGGKADPLPDVEIQGEIGELNDFLLIVFDSNEQYRKVCDCLEMTYGKRRVHLADFIKKLPSLEEVV